MLISLIFHLCRAARQLPAPFYALLYRHLIAPLCCAWCWPRKHPGHDYPECWSSTMCQHCRQVTKEQRQAKKVARTSLPQPA